MTIEIIKRGAPKAEKPITCTCRGCDSILRFKTDSNDVRLVYDQRDGDYFQLKCPVCGDDVKVAKSISQRI